jgi:hypothetical protein
MLTMRFLYAACCRLTNIFSCFVGLTGILAFRSEKLSWTLVVRFPSWISWGRCDWSSQKADEWRCDSLVSVSLHGRVRAQCPARPAPL